MRSQFKNERGKLFLPHWDLNHGPLKSKASVLPMSYTEGFSLVTFQDKFRMNESLFLFSKKTYYYEWESNDENYVYRV